MLSPMHNSPFKHFRRSLASLSLLAATGCASMMGTYYRAEYSEPPQSFATADQETAELSRPEFSTELAPDTQQPAETAEPLIALAAVDEAKEQPIDLAALFGEVASADAPSSDTRVTDENPFDLIEKKQRSVSPPDFVLRRLADQQAKTALENADVSDPNPTPSEINGSQSGNPVHNPFAEFEPQQSAAVDSNGPAIVRISSRANAAAASTFRAAEPRLPGNQKWCPPAASVTVGATQHPQAYPDEYIFDGGDRDTPVHYFGGAIEGLDTEDTVAEFKDHKGDSHIKASNRVAVYAPRFGAVETVTGPGIDVKIDKAAGARDISSLGKLHEERGMNMNVARIPASGVAVRSSAGGIETAQPAHMGRKTETVVMSSRVEQGFEAMTTRGLGLLEISDVHELNLQILEPGNSNTTTFVGQRAATSQATETYAMFRLASMTGSEDGGVKGEIHITKEASPLIAKSNDVITFRIHFRNTGDYNVSEVRIIDNLTPRLVYISGTGEVKVPDGGAGDLSVMPNKDGGQLLQFELDQPLKGGQSGTITFQAKVL